MTIRLFLSYSHQDKSKADEIYQELSEEGFYIWKDDRNVRQVDEFWISEAIKSINECDFFILAASANVRKSTIIPHEVDLALSKNKQIVMLRLDSSRIPTKLGLRVDDKLCVDFRKSDWRTRLSALFRTAKDSVPHIAPDRPVNFPSDTSSSDSYGLFPEINAIKPCYTDAEEIRAHFRKTVAAPQLPYHGLIIHGVPGVGKRSLLFMLADQCLEMKIPVAIFTAETVEEDAASDILRKWSNDLSAQGYTFAGFRGLVDRYDRIAGEAFERLSAFSIIRGYFRSRSSQSIQRLDSDAHTVSWEVPIDASIKDFLQKINREIYESDLRFARELSSALTAAFLEEINACAKNQRLVLMIDSYERLRRYDEWLLRLFIASDPNILFVIAGREITGDQPPAWSTILSLSDVRLLDPMGERDAHDLIRKVFRAQTGRLPDPKEVKVIWNKSRGLPFAAKHLIEVWKHDKNLGEFRLDREHVPESVVQYLLKKYPRNIRRLVKVASIVRSFHRPMLEQLLGRSLSHSEYSLLCRLEISIPSVIRMDGREWRQIQPSFAEIVYDNLQETDKSFFLYVNRKAIDFYRAKWNAVKNEGWPIRRRAEYDHYAREIIYHFLRVGKEKDAVLLSRNVIEEALGRYDPDYAKSVVQILDDHLRGTRRKSHNRRWIVFFQWILARFSADIAVQSATAQLLLDVLYEKNPDIHLWIAIATVMGDLPQDAKEIAKKAAGKRVAWLEKTIQKTRLTLPEKVDAFLYIGGAYREKACWKKAMAGFDAAYKAARQLRDPFRMVLCLDGLAYTHLLMGYWEEAIAWAEKGVEISRLANGYHLTTTLKTLGWAHTHRGDLAEALVLIREALALAEERKDQSEIIRLSRRLAEIYDRQGNWLESNRLYLEYIEVDHRTHREVSMSSYLALLGNSYLNQGRYEEAEETCRQAMPRVDKHNKQNADLCLGQLQLMLGMHSKAKRYFRTVVLENHDRPYYIAKAKLGLALADYATGNRTAARKSAVETKRIALRYGYFDILAKLRLFQAVAKWNRKIPARGKSLADIFQSMKDSLLYSLQYNGYLADEVIHIGIRDLPIPSIINLCRSHGVEGRKMLSDLRDWWKSGSIDISPRKIIGNRKKVIKMPAFERLIHKRELGVNSKYTRFLDRVNEAIFLIEDS
jgi:tetratricopeptide (TPR) repeat protein